MMKLFSGDVDNFARSLAQSIFERFPPKVANDASRPVSVTRLSAILETAMDDASQFAVNRKLGWFGKAKLGTTFKWALKEHGYNESFVEMATEALIVYVTRQPQKAAPANSSK